MCSAAAISSDEAGALLTCRKGRILSGLSCEGRGIGGGSSSQGLVFPTIRLNFFNFFRCTCNFFRAAGVSYPGQHTTGWPPSVRLDGISRKRENPRKIEEH